MSVINKISTTTPV